VCGGKITAVYRSVTGGADDLDCGVWRLPCWRDYFATGTIDLQLPLLDDRGRPDKDITTRCTREIFLKRQDVQRFVKKLRVAKKPTSRSIAGKKRITEIVRRYRASLPTEAIPSQPGLEAFASEEANLIGHRAELRRELQNQAGFRGRGRPSKKSPEKIAKK